MWRNWQTRRLQVAVSARTYRFESCHGHSGSGVVSHESDGSRSLDPHNREGEIGAKRKSLIYGLPPNCGGTLSSRGGVGKDLGHYSRVGKAENPAGAPLSRHPSLLALRSSTILPPCGRGGIGRRARFRSWWGNTRGGSSPLARNTLTPYRLCNVAGSQNNPIDLAVYPRYTKTREKLLVNRHLAP